MGANRLFNRHKARKIKAAAVRVCEHCGIAFWQKSCPLCQFQGYYWDLRNQLRDIYEAHTTQANRVSNKGVF